MKRKFDFDYDLENDDLFLFNPKSKSKGSVEMGDLILDFNSQKELVGIEIINASKFMKNLVDETPLNLKKLMTNLKSCRVDVKLQNSVMLIKFHLFSETRALAPIISVPAKGAGISNL